MKHYEQSNLAEIFNQNFKAENLKIGKIVLNAHYSVIPMEEVVGIYVIDNENNDDDRFAERFEKFNSHNGWVHLAAGMSIFIENQHIDIIHLERKYIESVAHFSQKDVLKMLGKPEDKLNDNCDLFYDPYSSGCYIWSYYKLQLKIYFDGENRKIEEIHLGIADNLLKFQDRSELSPSFWTTIKLFFTEKFNFMQKEKPEPIPWGLTNSIYELKQGKSYRVIKEFINHDHRVHPVGETWIFDETNYLPYDSGLSLFVIQDGIRTQYRFQDIEEEQGKLLQTFMDYVERVGS